MALALIHLLILIAGLAFLWLHGNIWIAVGAFMLVWAHNMEKHAGVEIDWREHWEKLYERIKRK